jgi:hypothetical protein
MFKDEHRDNEWQKLRQRGLQPFLNLLTPEVMQKAVHSASLPIGKSALNVCTLIWLGIVGALHTTKNFAGVLIVTTKLLEDFSGQTPKPRKDCHKRGSKNSKHNPRGTSTNVTEEAFVQARQKLPPKLWMWLLMTLADSFQQQHPEYVRWKRFRLLMLDGSDIALPNWKRLLDYYGAAGSGKARTPQARMLMLAFAQARLPWRYDVVPQSCHEQTSAKRLLQHLDPGDLVLMDRGFWSYGLFWLIQQQRAYFGIRLRAGVLLRHVKWLGSQDELVNWTPAKRSKKKCSWAGTGLPKTIQLRVIRYHIRGFRPSAVVTNVLRPQDISRQEWVRMAAIDERGEVLVKAGLYHRRWEIETLFCELKVIQGMEGSLRSRTHQGIEFEIGGHVLLYFLIRWLMVEAAKKHGTDPLLLSFKHALDEFNDLRPLLIISSILYVRIVLLPQLLSRIAQHRIPVRPGRHFPRPADEYKHAKHRKRTKTKRKET